MAHSCSLRDLRNRLRALFLRPLISLCLACVRVCCVCVCLMFARLVNRQRDANSAPVACSPGCGPCALGIGVAISMHDLSSALLPPSLAAAPTVVPGPMEAWRQLHKLLLFHGSLLLRACLFVFVVELPAASFLPVGSFSRRVERKKKRNHALP